MKRQLVNLIYYLIGIAVLIGLPNPILTCHQDIVVTRVGVFVAVFR